MPCSTSTALSSCVPMMRGLLGWYAQDPAGPPAPVDDHIEVHKLFGNVLFFVGLVHAGAHLMNYLTLRCLSIRACSAPWPDSPASSCSALCCLVWFFARDFYPPLGAFRAVLSQPRLYGHLVCRHARPRAAFLVGPAVP